MKRRNIIILSVVAALTLVVLYGYKEYNRTNKDLLHEKPFITLNAASLIESYERDSSAFNQKYIDKIIAVNGVVKKVDANDNPVVIALGKEGSMSSVQCSMDSTHASLYSNIKEGAAITIKGICTGGRTDEMFGTDVILNRSVVINNQQ